MFKAVIHEGIVLVALFLLYQVIYKLSTWRSALMRIVVPRTRLLVYLSFVFYSLWRILLHMPSGPWKPLAVEISQGTLYLLVCSVCIETVHLLVFDYLLAHRQKIDVPHIFRDLIRATLYVIVFVLLFRFVYNTDVTSLLAASGLVAIMLGFALQTVMNDFFAGMSMQMTRPYALGDWVRIGDKEGKVEHIDWRSTVLRTFYDDFLILPNNKLAHEAIINYSQPSTFHLHNITVSTHPRHAPAKVEAIIKSSLSGIEHVHHDRGYHVVLDAFEDSGLRWRVKFWISEFNQYPHIESDVRQRIWYAFQRAGIDLSTPQRMVLPPSASAEELHATAVRLFSRIDWLSQLSAEDQAFLAGKVRLVQYGVEEVVVRQGDAGESMFLIGHGQVEIRARRDDDTIFMRKTLGVGDFFGEISALTGEPRTADVVALEDSSLLVLGKEALRKIVAGDCELISGLVARRQELSQQREDSRVQEVVADGPGEDKSNPSTELFRKIRAFFAY